jgi:hypothetical protein
MKILVICACLFGASAVHAATHSVKLQNAVTVQSESLRLSDLLAADAPPQLKIYAQKVSLGRAPDVGSLRVFTGSELRAAVSAKFPAGRDATALEIPEQVIVRRSGWPLGREAVRESLIKSKLSLQFNFVPAQITLPADFATRTPHSQLEILSLARSEDQHRLLARVRCRERSACGTFLAEIEFPDSSIEAVVTTSPSREVDPRTIAQNIAILPLRGPVLVHPGTAALLVIEGDGFTITERVMPLKRGHMGEVVSVSDPLTHRSRFAEVSGSGLLGPPRSSPKAEAR